MSTNRTIAHMQRQLALAILTPAICAGVVALVALAMGAP